MTRIRAVFFDAGHTLLHAHPSLGEVYAAVTARFGAKVEPAAIYEVFVPIFQEFVKGTGGSAFTSDELDFEMWRAITRRIYERMPALAPVDFDAWFRALYDTFGRADVWCLYDDVMPVLDELRRRDLKLGVISNWDTRLRGILADLGVLARVDFALISAETGVRKPHVEIFRRALAQAGVEAHEALHVGDLYEDDYLGATRAGLSAVLIDRRGTVGIPTGTPRIVSLRELLLRPEAGLPSCGPTGGTGISV